MIIYDEKALITLLVETAIVDKKRIDAALADCKTKKIPLYQQLLDDELLSDENLGQIFADLFGVPFIRLSHVAIPHTVLTIIPEVYAKKNSVISFKRDASGIGLAMSNPKDTQIRSFIEKKTGIPTTVYFATESDITNAYALYSKSVELAFEEIINQNILKAKESTKQEPPIIKIVDTILSYAHQNRASDIHIEPGDNTVLVRFRIDGLLHDIVNLPYEVHEQIVSRIKVLARLRTDEHQAAQDGKIQYKTGSEMVDLRVSIVPITDGEKIVMRLLSEKSRQYSLSDLGFEKTDLEKVQSAYKKPYGMIIATGPTGSGKTTTMYAILKQLNKPDVNIMTIEDPVEYDIERINQIQVNPKTNLTFAAGLRSIVRQDPDIILVGEIRDEETAGIAINAAMTGHLVLSTLHTNDAATTIPRLFDMKIEPFLVASTINVIVAQRLIRKICVNCRTSKELQKSDVEKQFGKHVATLLFGNSLSINSYYGKGCPVCHETGYAGRIGIYEVLVVDDEIRESINAQKNAAEIAKIAIKNGMETMLQDGIMKVKNGITTIDEIMRSTIT